MKEYNYLKEIFLILLFVTAIFFLEVLKITASFSMPVCLAILVSFVFYPLIKKLNESFKIPWVVSVIALVAIVFVAIYVLGNLLVSSFASIGANFPKYEERFIKLYKTTAHIFNFKINEDDSVFLNLWNNLNLGKYIQTAAISISNYIFSTAKLLFLIILLTVFLLLEMNTFHTKIRNIFTTESRGRKAVEITDRIIREVTHYISIKFTISLITGILVFASCYFANVDFAIIWGFLAFILNFIPTFGSIISWALTTIFAFMQYFPSWGTVLFIAISVLVINFTLGNIIEPRWEGSDLGISPFFILISLSIFSYVWGFMGMILAVPLLVIIKIACENIELLHPLAVLIGVVKKTSRQDKEVKNQQ
ncbi:AI-2E family transporter [Treponema sp.]|uniref:AI-2E family transporter n=1 Tax=Treponema sp. TaxID=166 RepID=UPI0025E1023C|nr:AI-2E family transporter [Treponema sp.]MCR5217323.1 AI-2E family transporter [Treponema sp.]